MTLNDFRKDFDALVKKHGWSYNGSRNWRSELIYNTNIRTAYAAGRWQQLTDPDSLKLHPYLEYRHGDSLHPRPQHLAWDGLTLPADDPWWQTHYPPNGWGCRCKVLAANKRDLERAGKEGPDPAPAAVIDPKTGREAGMDKGWEYNVGQGGQLNHEAVLGEKLASLPPEWRKRAYGELVEKSHGFRDQAFGNWGKAVLADVNGETGRIKTIGQVVNVHHIEPETMAALVELGFAPETTAIGITDSEWLHLQHREQPAAANRDPAFTLTEAEALRLPRYLREGEPWWDSQERRLLYLFSPGERNVKAAVAVNYRHRGERVNLVRSARAYDPKDIFEGKVFRRLPQGQ